MEPSRHQCFNTSTVAVAIAHGYWRLGWECCPTCLYYKLIAPPPNQLFLSLVNSSGFAYLPFETFSSLHPNSAMDGRQTPIVAPSGPSRRGRGRGRGGYGLVRCPGPRFNPYALGVSADRSMGGE